MATYDLMTTIREGYEHYTKAEKKVAQFVLEQPKKILFMSISDLADACAVGDTSVFRFCRSLKLQGYQEFKMKLSLSLGSEGESEDNINLGEVSLKDPFDILVKKILQNNLNAIHETYSLIESNTFNTAITYLEEAQNIHFFGVGASSLSAMVAMNKFLRITPNVHCMMDSHMQAMTAAMLSEKDLAVVISYSGATKDTIHVAKLAKESGAKVVSITRFAKSPMTIHSDVTILCGANEGPLDGGSTSAQMSQMFLIDVMYMEYYRRKIAKSSSNKQKTASAVIEKIY
ncbi:MAG: MurR/RpiR family transcriptional regulator [Cellulosilyticaceae bacterium]